MPKNRMSSLPTALYCGLSPRLGAEHGAGRAAFQSTAYHARMSRTEGWEQLWDRLTEEEREETSKWSQPGDIDLGEGVVLKYEHAHKEIEVGLTEDLEYCEPSDPRCISVGHIDMAWDPIEINGLKVAYVGDAKRTAFTSSVTTLQLDAYGHAWASMVGADAYGCGLWILEDSEWRWRREVVELNSMDSARLAGKLLAAIGNDDQPVTGSHCRDCYSRFYCPEHLIPAAALVRGKEDALAPFSEPNGITKENAAQLVLQYQAGQDLLKAIKESLETWAGQNGGISDGNGKVWKQLNASKPGEKLDEAALRGAYPDVAKEFTRATPARNMGFRWVKE